MASIVKSDSSPPDQVIAAFDLGSNSIKMTVARRGDVAGSVNEFLWRSETVRLGLGVDESGELAADRIRAALDTLVRFSNEAKAAGATRLLGVATEATRVALNGAAFLAEVEAATGIELQAISGDREASLTFLGLQGKVDLGGEVIVADIGGGSTEIIIASNKAVQWSHSFPLGSGRLAEQLIEHDPPLTEELGQCQAAAIAMLASAPLAGSTGGRLIIVGGTGEYIATLIDSNVPKTPERLSELIDFLATIPVAALAEKLSIAEARARVLPAGVAIALGIADGMKPSVFEAAQSGIRRGLLLAAFAGEM